MRKSYSKTYQKVHAVQKSSRKSGWLTLYIRNACYGLLPCRPRPGPKVLPKMLSNLFCQPPCPYS